MMERSDLWDLRLMLWEDFTDAVVSQSGPRWKILCGADLLIGGVDFSDNFV
jgi:hypothetical protein